MNLNKIMAIGLLSICTFSQNAGADKVEVGRCLSSRDIRMTQTIGKLTYTLLRSRDFQYADFLGHPTRSVYCRYDMFAISFEVPRDYSYRTCSFSKDTMVDRCTEKNGEDCIVYCDLAKK